MCSFKSAQYVLVEFIESHRKFFLLRKRTVPLPRLSPPDGELNGVAFASDDEGDWASFADGIAYGVAEDGFEELLDVGHRPTCPAGGRSLFFSDSSLSYTPSLASDRSRYGTQDSLYGQRSAGLCELHDCCCVLLRVLPDILL